MSVKRGMDRTRVRGLRSGRRCIITRSDRTVLAADNTWFTFLTMNTHPLHFDTNYAAKTQFGRPLVNSCLTLSIVTGQSVTDLSQNAVANLSWTDIQMPHPVFDGDTLYSRSEVLDVRESKSRPEVGIVRVKTTGVNQDGTIVLTFERTFMVYKRAFAPSAGPVHAEATR